ncbi:MAG: class I SAM-dependent methyltransferase [Flavobacteriaceae bacterium]|nr:class I SAM-dependent methyltransferase [Flavobacteriaceae bacterium]
MKQKEWFVDWFDSEYYHILYKDRNYKEAELFMTNLVNYLKLKKESFILDLACGKGRHSVFLNKLGFTVNGIDLSKNSIKYAKQFQNDTLNFEVHDMRIPFDTKYNAIFNLFTSFGYFNDDQTNIKVLKNIKNGLFKNGVAVIDFMNIETVSKNLVAQETITKNGIVFKIKRVISDQRIIKDIWFTVNKIEYHFTEKVQCLTFETIKRYILKAGLQLKTTFGDYNLTTFDLKKSKRLILVVCI